MLKNCSSYTKKGLGVAKPPASHRKKDNDEKVANAKNG